MASPGSTSTALVRKRAAVEKELMPPPPPTKKIKRPKQILDEETYTDALSKIIARDFFPGLLESETQQEYLDALDSNDQSWIQSAGRRLEHVMTPGRQRLRRPVQTQAGGRTPVGAVGDTPMSTISGVTAASEVPAAHEIDTNMSLSAFQGKYTSEDNESFYKLLDKQNQKRAGKYGWLWRGNKLPSKQELKQMEIKAKLAASGRSLVDDGFKKDRLAIQGKDDRPAVPDTWRSDPKNGLMFNPESFDEDRSDTVALRSQEASRAAPKTIVYENTRMPGPAIAKDTARPPSPTLSAVRDAISGRMRPGYQDSSVTVGDETPRVNGYAFVDDEEPEVEAAASALPVINLSPGDEAKNPFQIQEQGKRESLHHRMVDRIAQSKRTSAKVGFVGKVEKTPVPKFPNSPRVSGGLTPAAQRLWSQVGGASRASNRTPFPGTVTPKSKSSGLKTMTKH
jgi:protein DGCR14